MNIADLKEILDEYDDDMELDVDYEVYLSDDETFIYIEPK